MTGFEDPIGAVKPFIGDILPRGYEDADGQPVRTFWSPIYGTIKPNLMTSAGGHKPAPGFLNYRFIIKVASPDASLLDKIVRDIFDEETSAVK